MTDWFDELALEPDAHPVAMGIHALGERPWLIKDRDFDIDLALKAELLDSHRDEVLFETPESLEAATAVLELIQTNNGATGYRPHQDDPPHPIETAARLVQEDLCLLHRHEDGWHLDASSVSFPTRWNLQEKVGHHIAAVHSPVDGYDPRITQRVDRLFDQLSDRPVWRRNWFLMTDRSLFQPTRPEAETILSRDVAREQMYVRSERQTLRQVIDGWVLFTIRIQHATLNELLTTPERVNTFANWVNKVPPDFGRRRHLTGPQRRELLAALAPAH